MRRVVLAAIVLFFVPTGACLGQVIGVALDSKVVLVDGKPQVPAGKPADAAAFFRFTDSRIENLGKVAVPTSYLGPPSSVAVSADGALALVTASFRRDPADPGKLVPDDRLSVIDLTASPLRVVQTLHLGLSPSSVRISPDGRIALVMSNPDDRLIVLSIEGHHASIVQRLTPLKGGGPHAAAFAVDGKRVLITLPDAQKVGMYAIDHGRLRLPAIRELTAGVTPFAVAFCGTSGYAVVNNFGSASGDTDTVSLIDVSGALPRVIDTASVGPAPEDVACSPDGRYVAASVQNLSNRPATAPFHATQSKLVVLEIAGKRLRRVAETSTGAWAEGAGFLDDSRTLFIQSIVDRSMAFYRIEGGQLVRAMPTQVFEHAAPVAYGIGGR
ncbi:YncE family protein [Frateuria hangzhouensis]|uniref:YncE family protein n=1 Tax=Frateuria hangzhouensis TaxID=2995589 RepID=UPI002260938E|nr:hypothetical protein [Frateuria sp. STR12]MCX7512150.1 hypothetical protein [Frateuria sp. STR12]